MNMFLFSLKYGIYEVDFNSPDLTRTPRYSAFVYTEILRTRTILKDYNPEIIDEEHQTDLVWNILI